MQVTVVFNGMPTSYVLLVFEEERLKRRMKVINKCVLRMQQIN